MLSKAQRPMVAIVTIAAAVVLTSGSRFENDFVFDDQSVIVRGEIIHDVHNLPRALVSRTMYISASDDGSVDSLDTYRPLSVATFFVDASWSGRSPIGYHLTNLLLHLLCSLGVFLVGRRLTRLGVAASCFGAIVFATHPWLVEAHVWINGRSDPLALLCVLFAVGFGTSSLRWATVGMGASFLLALFAKETPLLLAPALVALPTAGSWPSRDAVKRRAMAIGGACLVYLLARNVVLGGAKAGSGEALERAVVALPVFLVDAIVQTIAPRDVALRSLRDEYLLETWHVVGACVLLAALAVVAWRLRKQPPLLVALYWWIAPLVPGAVIATVLWPAFGRYLYIGTAGFAWIASVVLSRAHAVRPKLTVSLATMYLAVLSFQTVLATHTWRDDDALYSHAIETHPDSAMGYGWLGMSLSARGRFEESIPFLEAAVDRDPTTHRYLTRLGQSLVEVGRVQHGSAIAQLGIERFEGRPEEAAYRMLAVRTMTRVDPEAAAEHLTRCLEVWPNRSDCVEAISSLGRDVAHAAAFRNAASRRPTTLSQVTGLLPPL